jgi:predicted nuclease with TOPRIM domain
VRLKVAYKLAIDTILYGLTNSMKSKVGSCASSKEIWDKLQDLYVREDAEEDEEEENHEETIIQKEDENLKKLKHVEVENSKLKDTQRKLRSELGSCEKTVVILMKQLEDFEKLREVIILVTKNDIADI